GLLLAGMAGCGSNDPVPAATATPTATVAVAVAAATPSTSAAPTVSGEAQPTEQIHPAGIGPFVVGAPLARLQGSGALSNVQPIAQCPTWTTADGTGDYAFVHATFSKGALVWIEVTTGTLSTVEGAIVGMALDEVEGMYSGKGVPLTNASGSKALGVPGEPNTGTGLLLRTTADAQISVIEAGTYDLLKLRFVDGKGC
ncbi:MAG: hypothetical protein QOG64_1967, partial [Acidimicrobiaceae bacterium]|nr:hypothetical protein [Acidimicrobiaceae bacterium]